MKWYKSSASVLDLAETEYFKNLVSLALSKSGLRMFLTEEQRENAIAKADQLAKEQIDSIKDALVNVLSTMIKTEIRELKHPKIK